MCAQYNLFISRHKRTIFIIFTLSSDQQCFLISSGNTRFQDKKKEGRHESNKIHT
jgi:hypothetical protein